jgi:hypothetical protein
LSVSLLPVFSITVAPVTEVIEFLVSVFLPALSLFVFAVILLHKRPFSRFVASLSIRNLFTIQTVPCFSFPPTTKFGVIDPVLAEMWDRAFDEQ